jgi:adenylate cyclase
MGKALQTSKESRGPRQRSPLSGRAIRSQLERILNHPEFKATERMQNLLSHVVNETLAGNAAQLKGYTIATDVHGSCLRSTQADGLCVDTVAQYRS